MSGERGNRKSIPMMREELLLTTGVQADDYVRGVQAALRWAIGMSDEQPSAGIRDQLPLVYPRAHDGSKVPMLRGPSGLLVPASGPPVTFPVANPGEIGQQTSIEDVVARSGLAR